MSALLILSSKRTLASSVARPERSLQKLHKFGVNLGKKAAKPGKMSNDFIIITDSDYNRQLVLSGLMCLDESAAIREYCTDTEFPRGHVRSACHHTPLLSSYTLAKYSVTEYNPPCFAAQPSSGLPSVLAGCAERRRIFYYL